MTTTATLHAWIPPYGSPAAACSTLAAYYNAASSVTYATWGYTCLSKPTRGTTIGMNSLCYPWRTVSSDNLPIPTFAQQWGPATECPTGWTTATTSTITDRYDYSTVDAVLCCPTPFVEYDWLVSGIEYYDMCSMRRLTRTVRASPTTFTLTMEVPVTVCSGAPGTEAGTETTWTVTGELGRETTIAATPLELRYKSGETYSTAAGGIVVVAGSGGGGGGGGGSKGGGGSSDGSSRVTVVISGRGIIGIVIGGIAAVAALVALLRCCSGRINDCISGIRWPKWPKRREREATSTGLVSGGGWLSKWKSSGPDRQLTKQQEREVRRQLEERKRAENQRELEEAKQRWGQRKAEKSAQATEVASSAAGTKKKKAVVSWSGLRKKGEGTIETV